MNENHTHPRVENGEPWPPERESYSEKLFRFAIEAWLDEHPEFLWDPSTPCQAQLPFERIMARCAHAAGRVNPEYLRDGVVS